MLAACFYNAYLITASFKASTAVVFPNSVVPEEKKNKRKPMWTWCEHASRVTIVTRSCDGATEQAIPTKDRQNVQVERFAGSDNGSDEDVPGEIFTQNNARSTFSFMLQLWKVEFEGRWRVHFPRGFCESISHANTNGCYLPTCTITTLRWWFYRQIHA